MIGPAVPIPVSKEVLDALLSVQVLTTSGDTTSGFELKFSLSNRSPLHTLFLLSSGAPIPLIRVIVVVTLKGVPEILVDGVMTHHHVSPGDDGGTSVLTVKGKDLSAVMDYVDFSGIPYPAMPASARVALILAKYAVLGVIPVVIPTVFVDVPNPLERIPRQKGKDLQYVKQLADEVGYTFYLEPGPAIGSSIAYWGPELKVSAPQPALNLNMDAHTNVESLDFSYDTESKTLPVLYIQDPNTKSPIPIPVPDITPLNPPLGAIPPIPKGITPIRNVAKLSPLQATAIALAKASRSAEAVTGSGTLDVLRYGRVLKARRLVGVRGAGPAFDGLHYVKSVTHDIKPGEYKQSFTLVRNGLLPTVSRVPA